MALFRFPHSWPTLIPPDSPLADAVPLLDDRDRDLEDYLAARSGESGNSVVAYTTGGVQITYTNSYVVAPVPTFNIETPAAGHPHACYIASATATGFLAVIYDNTGAETGAGGLFRIFWHAQPAGA